MSNSDIIVHNFDYGQCDESWKLTSAVQEEDFTEVEGLGNGICEGEYIVTCSAYLPDLLTLWKVESIIYHEPQIMGDLSTPPAFTAKLRSVTALSENSFHFRTFHYDLERRRVL